MRALVLIGACRLEVVRSEGVAMQGPARGRGQVRCWQVLALLQVGGVVEGVGEVVDREGMFFLFFSSPNSTPCGHAWSIIPLVCRRRGVTRAKGVMAVWSGG